MRIVDLQQILSSFTSGKKGNAITYASIYIEDPTRPRGVLPVTSIEAQENNIIGDKETIRIVFKTKKKTIELL